jgi:hypothetical protein
MDVALVMFGLAAMDGLQIEGMAEDKGDAVFSTEVSQPVPDQHPFGSDDDRIAVRGASLEKRFGGGWHVTVPPGFTGVVEDAHVHGAGVSRDATVIRVLCGVESP